MEKLKTAAEQANTALANAGKKLLPVTDAMSALGMETAEADTMVDQMLCELFKYCAGDYESYQTESDDVSAKMMAAANKETCKYKESAKKIAFMVRRFEEDGFTAYWL